MFWLAAHMQVLLFVAFFIGLGVGWWIWRARPKDALPPREQPLMGTLDSDFQANAETAPPKDKEKE